MATPKSQRIGIWIIAIVMVIGTIGSFAVMVLASKNDTADKAKIQELSAQYQKDYKVYQDKVDAQAKKLSGKYYSDFNKYSNKPAKFNKSNVTTLKKEDLKEGSGEKLTQKSTFTAYYIGWTPDGKVFDSSISGGALKAPLNVKPGGVITGWTEGVDGMKVGGVRELTIPADKGYGSTGSGDKIPANSPLKFVIMVIPTPDAIAEPAVPQELLDYYNKNNVQ
ncbi:MAG TPA: FKBP-type peptidyl-prolyl cis-trans isomerase [Verrucomicrobiae bacterium]|jgi:FKBP-type peptidyl-prolyl cis-trans isomerase|nr:FKBP-type peptidyl-prolyl cis-trans isomerase [Verrucomicrobiae bacterium]